MISLEANSPSEFLQPNHCSRLSTRATTYLGFRPSPRRHHSASTRAGVPKSPLRSVPRHSQPLDGFLRAAARRLVSSRSRAQDHFPCRGFSLRTAVLLPQKAVPPCRSNKVRSPASGLPRTKLADFEALLRTEPRAVGSGVSLPDSRSPHRDPCSSRCSSRREPDFLGLLRSWRFERTIRRPCKHGPKRSAARLQRLGDEKPGRFVSDPTDLLELLSLLQLGNRENRPRADERHARLLPASSPEAPPTPKGHRRSRDPKQASLGFRTGSPTASPEGPPPDHRIVRRARPRPSGLDGVGHPPDHPEGRPVEVTGPTRRSPSARPSHPPALSCVHPEGHPLSGTGQLSFTRIPWTRRPTKHELGSRGSSQRPNRAFASPRRDQLGSARAAVAPSSVPLPKPRSRRVVRPRSTWAEPATALSDVDPKTPA